MYIINNRPNNKKKLYITIFTILIISALLIFLVWYLKKSSNSGTNTRNKTPYSNITGFFLAFQEDIYTYINDINNINKINQTKTKKHPNGLYKEIVYDDGSFLKISEQGKIQQAYCRLISRFNYMNRKPYKLYCYDENENLITLIEHNGTGYTIKDYTPHSHTNGLEDFLFKDYEKQQSKVTILSHDYKKIPYRTTIMKDDIDKKCNFIYNSHEVIYSQYQQEDGMKKLIDPYRTYFFIDKNQKILDQYKINSIIDPNLDNRAKEVEITNKIMEKLKVNDVLTIYNYDNYGYNYETTEPYKDVTIEKLEPGNYFLLYPKDDILLKDALYSTGQRLKEIKIIKKEDISDSQVPKELQYDKTKESDNSYSHIFKDGTIEYYNPKGELTSIKYPSKLTNNNIIFSYDSTKNRWSYKL
jgi:hypothetical protein